MSDSVQGNRAAARDAGGDPYDRLPYESRPFPDMQPDRLSALAVLHGLEPAEVVRGRVLELGCASGGNIVPLAARFPDASFIGIDLSARHVADGQARIRELGLPNIELRQGDIAACDWLAGRFDTIICHGVYSWVPPFVQDAILRIIGRHLASTGVACVSYNTLPGWHLRQIARDIFQYRTRALATAPQQIAEGLALLNELAEASDATRPYGQALRAEARLLAETSPSYVMGEHLAPACTPCYFHEFVDRASARGLAFLCEARPAHGLPEEQHREFTRRARAQAGDDPIAFEQYMDLFLGRQFRRTLLVSAERAHRISRTPAPERLAGLHLATTLTLDLDASSYGKLVFQHPDGRTFAPGDADACRAIELLVSIAPRTQTPEAICAAVVSAGSQDRTEREARVLDALLDMIEADFVTVSASAVRAGDATPQRPCAWPLARSDAAAACAWTTSLAHRIVTLDGPARWLLPQLDGQADRAMLARRLMAALATGEVAWADGAAADRPALLMSEAVAMVDRLVAFCADNALLEPAQPDANA